MKRYQTRTVDYKGTFFSFNNLADAIQYIEGFRGIERILVIDTATTKTVNGKQIARIVAQNY